MLRLAAGREGLDDVHAAAAAGALLDVLRGKVLVGVRLDGGHGKQLASLGDPLGFGSAGEQAVVADAVEALGQHVQQEAADELVASVIVV
jgi:hypothetical protein